MGRCIGRTFDSKAVAQLLKTNAILARRAYARTTKWLTATTTQIGPYDDVLVLTPQMEAINPAVDDPELSAPIRESAPTTKSEATRNTAGPS